MEQTRTPNQELLVWRPDGREQLPSANRLGVRLYTITSLR